MVQNKQSWEMKGKNVKANKFLKRHASKRSEGLHSTVTMTILCTEDDISLMTAIVLHS
jgi:hypothetical protein